jgi:hypothetical protein
MTLSFCLLYLIYCTRVVHTVQLSVVLPLYGPAILDVDGTTFVEEAKSIRQNIELRDFLSKKNILYTIYCICLEVAPKVIIPNCLTSHKRSIPGTHWYVLYVHIRLMYIRLMPLRLNGVARTPLHVERQDTNQRLIVLQMLRSEKTPEKQTIVFSRSSLVRSRFAPLTK